MFLLPRADFEQAVKIQTADGYYGIHYRGHQFINREAYSRLQDAIKACRSDLENGLLSIVIQDNDQFGVWAELRVQSS